MACPASSRSSTTSALFPAILDAHEICGSYPFTHPSLRELDLHHLRSHLPRALSVLVTLLSQHKKERYQTPDLRGNSDVVTRSDKVFVELEDFKGEPCNMRFLVPSLERFEAQPNFFVIGFFGFIQETSPVIKQIWDLDDKLLNVIPSLDGILAYITFKKDDGQYFNYVFLKNFEMVDKWRGIRFHESAVGYSPKYYKHVRINHCTLPCSILSLLENQANINKLDIVRTKYYAYHDGKLVWSGMRVYKPDEVYKSLAYFKAPRPFTFASFLGDNAFNFYSQIVACIGKATGLPVKMIDVAALTRGISPRPADIDSIAKYNIDFAFTCGISYVNYAPNLIALAAPVRVEERYQDKPIYFSDVIVKADSSFKSKGELKSKTFAINERVSLSGHLMPHYHFLKEGGLQQFFGKVIESTSHANSINFVADGKADAASIDSVVLDMEFKQNPERKNQLRIIESTLPCTMPPFVASAWVPSKAQEVIARAITQMHKQHGAMLAENGFSRFAPVEDKDYESVRHVRKMYHHQM